MVKPPEALAAIIAAMLGLVTGRPDSLLHITLLPLGDRAAIDARTFARIIAALDAVALPSFRVAFDHVGGRDRTILLPSEPPRGAFAVQRALAAALAARGLRLTRPYRFHPHVTLDYRHGIAGDVAIDPISWRVEDIRLIESVVGETRHVEHGRWALGGMDRAA